MTTPPIPAHDHAAPCPGCGCRHAPVEATRETPGRTVKRQRCARCGRAFVRSAPASPSTR